MRKTLTAIALAALALSAVASSAGAQTYSFQVPEETVDVFLESDGSMRLVYRILFENAPGVSPIDFVDVGMPTGDYDLGAIQAWIDGQPIRSIETSPYVSPGVALGLGADAIPAGSRGEVVMEVPRVGDVLYAGEEEGYASVQFSPNYFDPQFTYGPTDLTVTFHLPPGIQPEEPRWYVPTGGWPSQDPATGIDDDGRIIYSWRNTQANAHTQYVFGAAFPSDVVPQGTLQSPPSALGGLFAGILGFFSFLASCAFPGLPIILFIVLFAFAQRRRRLAYLPPKISVEGHGIKRGLTAVEAAVVMQTPLDKVLTMVLFGLVRKGAARVVAEDPLELEPLAQPEGELRTYETAFLKAAVEKDRRARQRGFEGLMIDLVRSVEKKMKGFSLKETREYYASIMRKAWAQIEEAGTPEVRSEKYTEGIEWLMLDGDFTGRTRRVFEGQPVYVPHWWGYYSPPVRSTPVARAPGPARPAAAPSGRGVSLPHLPGSDFAASIARGVETRAASLVGNITNFTQGVAKTTNPPPVTRSYGGRSGGGGCACACACAGCACACAGGGR